MRTWMKTALGAAAVGVSPLPAPTLAHDMGAPERSMMGPGMMGQGGMMSGMMNMMGKSDDMARMMGRWHEMMQSMGDHDHGPARPSEQWRERALSNPSEKG